MLKQHHYLILVLVDQVLAQSCQPTTPSNDVNQVVLFNASSWTSYFLLNNTSLVQLSTSNCDGILCSGENETNLIVSPKIQLASSVKVTWKATTNSTSCDLVMAVVYNANFPSDINTLTASSSCSAMSLTGSFNAVSDFYFGFSLNTTAASNTCIKVSNVSVWYTYCNATTTNLVRYNTINDGSMANGTCVPNANASSSLQATCSGSTLTPQSACTCNSGYANVMNTSCQSITSSPPPQPSPSSPSVATSGVQLTSKILTITYTSSSTYLYLQATPSSSPVQPSGSLASSSLLPPSPTSSTAPPPSDTAAPFPLAVIIGAAAGGAALAILIVIIIIIVVCVCRIQVNRQGFYQTNEDKVTEPTMLRYSASLRSLTSQTVVPIDGRAAVKENEFYV